MQLEEVLELAQDNSPFISAAQLNEIAARKAILIAKAGYFPILNLEGIETTGFPGSSGIMGVQGLMGSPYRKGLSAGLVAKQTIYDFGRTSAEVKKSTYEAELARESRRVTSYQVKRVAMETFYECSRFRTQKAIWEDLSTKSADITKEVKKFVSTGQKSIVDKYLSEAQTQEAFTNAAYFTEQTKGSLNELAILLGLPSVDFTCPVVTGQKALSNIDPSNPFVERAKMDVNIALATYERERANLYPKIVTFSSLGVMDKARLVEKKEYAVGLSFIYPLYDLSSIANVKRAKAIIYAKNEEVEAQRQFVDNLNAKFDTIIDASKVRLNHLTTELELADEAFTLAKKRYIAMEGELIDLRESFRNLLRVKVETEETRANLLQAKAEKMLLNGERE